MDKSIKIDTTQRTFSIEIHNMPLSMRDSLQSLTIEIEEALRRILSEYYSDPHLGNREELIEAEFNRHVLAPYESGYICQ